MFLHSYVDHCLSNALFCKNIKLFIYLDLYFRYVMDELGSAIRHNDEPNFRVAPFMYMPDGTLQSAIRYLFVLNM